MTPCMTLLVDGHSRAAYGSAMSTFPNSEHKKESRRREELRERIRQRATQGSEDGVFETLVDGRWYRVQPLPVDYLSSESTVEKT